MIKRQGGSFEMKRVFVFLVCAAMTLSLTFCAPAPIQPDHEDTRAASIERLCDKTGLSAEQADELLALLASLGYSGEVLFAYPATDTDEAVYYHVWIGERTVDVYLTKDGETASIRQNGIVLYGNGPSEAPNIPEQQPTASVELTLRLDGMTEQVTAGKDAYVRAVGRAGEEYRIEVYLKSGLSTAKGLEVKTAGEDGSLLWEWKISARTTPGDYRIVIVRVSDERDLLELPLTVLPKVKQ